MSWLGDAWDWCEDAGEFLISHFDTPEGDALVAGLAPFLWAAAFGPGGLVIGVLGSLLLCALRSYQRDLHHLLMR